MSTQNYIRLRQLIPAVGQFSLVNHFSKQNSS